MSIDNPVFWLALGQIIWINIILSGDNAVVIALAARSLPPKQQKMAIMWGSGAAVVLRIALTFVAALLLKLPYLQLIGGALLLWIGLQLMSEGGDDDGESKEHGSLMAAVRTILIADLVMSLDNVIAVALAAKGDFTLLVLGLAISIPLVIFGSSLMIKLMERFPIIVTLGAALIGWVAGDAITHDVAEFGGTTIKAFFEANGMLGYAVKAGCAVLVVVIGKWLAHKGAKAAANA